MAEKKDPKKKEIPKVIELNPSSVVPTLENLLERAKAGQIDSFIFAGFTPENLLISSKADLDIISQQHLVAYLQTETTIRAISESYVIPIYDSDEDDDDDDPEN